MSYSVQFTMITGVQLLYTVATFSSQPLREMSEETAVLSAGEWHSFWSEQGACWTLSL
jgi:hypothetical protein